MSFLTIEHYSSSFARSRRKMLLRRGVFACFVAVIPLFIFAYWLLDAKHFLAQAQSVNEQITYQGKVADGAGVALPNGPYNFYFELYTVASGGTPVWTEAWTATTTAGQVTVVNGAFTVALGTSTSLSTVNFASSSLYLQVYYDEGSDGSFDEMFTPRKRLTASPYAFNADKLDGFTATDFISTSTYALPNVGSIGSSSATTTVQGNLAVLGSANIQGVDWATTTIGNFTDHLDVECTPFFGFCVPTLSSYIGGSESVTGVRNAMALIAGVFDPVFYFSSDDLATIGTIGYDAVADALNFGTSDSFSGGIVFNSGNGTTTFDNIVEANGTLYIQGLADSADSLGTNGMVLQTNGSVATWVATSSLGIGDYWTLNGSDLYNNSGTNIGINNNTPSYALDVSGFINTDQYSGYKQDGLTVLYSSSTNQSIAVGINAGAALLADGLGNVAVGYGALAVATSSDYNTAIGASALNDNTTGDYNTAIGNSALTNNTTGFRNTAIGYASLVSNTTGQLNTAIGYSALYYNDTGSNNVAIGPEALEMNISGTANVAIGAAASNNTSGGQNVAIGQFAMYENTTGDGNVAIGTEALRYNQSATSSIAIGQAAGVGTAPYSNERGIYIGSSAGLNVTTGSDDNVMIGYESGYNNTTGAGNSVLGTSALSMNTTGNYNTAFGYRAAIGNTTGDANAAVGTYALYGNTTGAYNSVLGSEALFNNGSATATVAIGYRAGYGSAPYANQGGVYIGFEAGRSADTGSNFNSFIGYQSGYSNTIGVQNTAVGSQSLYLNDAGTNNVAIGFQTLNNNTSGSYNTAVGGGALQGNSTGEQNTAVGRFAMASNSTGQNNVAVGTDSLYSSLTGSDNTSLGWKSAYYNKSATSTVSIGSYAGYGDVAGYDNRDGVYIGYRSGYNLQSGSDANTLIGSESGYANTTGTGNILLGYRAGDEITTGSNNIVIGYDIDAPSNTASNQLNIGNLIFSRGIDGTDTTLSSGNIGIGTTTPWRKFSVTGTVAFDGLTSNNGITDDLCIDPLTKEVVQNTGATTCVVSSQKYKHDIYDLTYDNMSALEKINILRPVSYKDNNTDQENLGFIAEEVIKVDPRLVFMEPGTTTDPRGVKYEQLTALLTKGIQEIWKSIQDIWEKLTAQDSKIKELENRIIQLEQIQGVTPASSSGSDSGGGSSSVGGGSTSDPAPTTDPAPVEVVTPEETTSSDPAPEPTSAPDPEPSPDPAPDSPAESSSDAGSNVSI